MEALETLRLKDKVSVVTGSGRGIGRSIAILFAQEGSKVAICSRTKSELDEVEQTISANGGACLSVVADVSNKTDVNSLVSRVLDQYGRIDILVNNAAISPTHDILHIPEEEWDKVIDTNLKSVYLCCKSVVPVMIEQKKGKIVNISSITGTIVSSSRVTHYSASKGGIMGFTISLALELAQYGINVNAISPGSIMTPGLERSWGPDMVNEMANSIPLKRIGDPMDIAYAAEFLASEESNYITGQTIVVDGGVVILETKT